MSNQKTNDTSETTKVPNNTQPVNPGRFVHIDLLDGQKFRINIVGINVFEAYSVVSILHEKLRQELGL